MQNAPNSPSAPNPQSVTISKIAVDSGAQLIQISWADGVTSDFPMEGLRRACPCVFCRGGHENMGKRMDPQDLLRASTRTWAIRGIKPVGNYALQIDWSDGHNTGLYRFEALRELWDDYTDLMTPKG
jgi:DUF971 family protein